MGTMSVTLEGGPGSPSRGKASGGSLTFDLPAAEGGSGTDFNGGEALLLAVAGCYANDLHRRAREAGIRLDRFAITTEGDWGGDPVVCTAIRCTLDMEADAAPEALDALRADLDAKAAIPLTLRAGIPVSIGLA